MAEALRKRLCPSVPLKLELQDDSGTKFIRNFRLAFDFNAVRAIEEETGFSLMRGEVWQHQTAKVLTAMLWAATLAHQGQYDTRDKNGLRTPDGLEVIGSYMTEENSEEIGEALWLAYLNYLSPAKRKIVVEARAEIEARPVPMNPAPAEVIPESATSSPGETSGPLPGTTSESPTRISAN